MRRSLEEAEASSPSEWLLLHGDGRSAEDAHPHQHQPPLQQQPHQHQPHLQQQAGASSSCASGGCDAVGGCGVRASSFASAVRGALLTAAASTESLEEKLLRLSAEEHGGGAALQTELAEAGPAVLWKDVPRCCVLFSNLSPLSTAPLRSPAVECLAEPRVKSLRRGALSPSTENGKETGSPAGGGPDLQSSSLERTSPASGCCASVCGPSTAVGEAPFPEVSPADTATFAMQLRECHALLEQLLGNDGASRREAERRFLSYCDARGVLLALSAYALCGWSGRDDDARALLFVHSCAHALRAASAEFASRRRAAQEGFLASQQRLHELCRCSAPECLCVFSLGGLRTLHESARRVRGGVGGEGLEAQELCAGLLRQLFGWRWLRFAVEEREAALLLLLQTAPTHPLPSVQRLLHRALAELVSLDCAEAERVWLGGATSQEPRGGAASFFVENCCRRWSAGEEALFSFQERRGLLPTRELLHRRLSRGGNTFAADSQTPGESAGALGSERQAVGEEDAALSSLCQASLKAPAQRAAGEGVQLLSAEKAVEAASAEPRARPSSVSASPLHAANADIGEEAKFPRRPSEDGVAPRLWRRAMELLRRASDKVASETCAELARRGGGREEEPSPREALFELCSSLQLLQVVLRERPSLLSRPDVGVAELSELLLRLTRVGCTDSLSLAPALAPFGRASSEGVDDVLNRTLAKASRRLRDKLVRVCTSSFHASSLRARYLYLLSSLSFPSAQTPRLGAPRAVIASLLLYIELLEASLKHRRKCRCCGRCCWGGALLSHLPAFLSTLTLQLRICTQQLTDALHLRAAVLLVRALVLVARIAQPSEAADSVVAGCFEANETEGAAPSFGGEEGAVCEALRGRGEGKGLKVWPSTGLSSGCLQTTPGPACSSWTASWSLLFASTAPLLAELAAFILRRYFPTFDCLFLQEAEEQQTASLAPALERASAEATRPVAAGGEALVFQLVAFFAQLAKTPSTRGLLLGGSDTQQDEGRLRPPASGGTCTDEASSAPSASLVLLFSLLLPFCQFSDAQERRLLHSPQRFVVWCGGERLSEGLGGEDEDEDNEEAEDERLAGDGIRAAVEELLKALDAFPQRSATASGGRAQASRAGGLIERKKQIQTASASAVCEDSAALPPSRASLGSFCLRSEEALCNELRFKNARRVVSASAAEAAAAALSVSAERREANQPWSGLAEAALWLVGVAGTEGVGASLDACVKFVARVIEGDSPSRLSREVFAVETSGTTTASEGRVSEARTQPPVSPTNNQGPSLLLRCRALLVASLLRVYLQRNYATELQTLATLALNACCNVNESAPLRLSGCVAFEAFVSMAADELFLEQSCFCFLQNASALLRLPRGSGSSSLTLLLESLRRVVALSPGGVIARALSQGSLKELLEALLAVASRSPPVNGPVQALLRTLVDSAETKRQAALVLAAALRRSRRSRPFKRLSFASSLASFCLCLYLRFSVDCLPVLLETVCRLLEKAAASDRRRLEQQNIASRDTASTAAAKDGAAEQTRSAVRTVEGFDGVAAAVVATPHEVCAALEALETLILALYRRRLRLADRTTESGGFLAASVVNNDKLQETAAGLAREVEMEKASAELLSGSLFKGALGLLLSAMSRTDDEQLLHLGLSCLTLSVATAPGVFFASEAKAEEGGSLYALLLQVSGGCLHRTDVSETLVARAAALWQMLVVVYRQRLSPAHLQELLLLLLVRRQTAGRELREELLASCSWLVLRCPAGLLPLLSQTPAAAASALDSPAREAPVASVRKNAAEGNGGAGENASSPKHRATGTQSLACEEQFLEAGAPKTQSSEASVSRDSAERVADSEVEVYAQGSCLELLLLLLRRQLLALLTALRRRRVTSFRQSEFGKSFCVAVVAAASACAVTHGQGSWLLLTDAQRQQRKGSKERKAVVSEGLLGALLALYRFLEKGKRRARAEAFLIHATDSPAAPSNSQGPPRPLSLWQRQLLQGTQLRRGESATEAAGGGGACSYASSTRRASLSFSEFFGNERRPVEEETKAANQEASSRRLLLSRRSESTHLKGSSPQCRTTSESDSSSLPACCPSSVSSFDSLESDASTSSSATFSERSAEQGDEPSGRRRGEKGSPVSRASLAASDSQDAQLGVSEAKAEPLPLQRQRAALLREASLKDSLRSALDAASSQGFACWEVLSEGLKERLLRYARRRRRLCERRRPPVKAAGDSGGTSADLKVESGRRGLQTEEQVAQPQASVSESQGGGESLRREGYGSAVVQDVALETEESLAVSSAVSAPAFFGRTEESQREAATALMTRAPQEGDCCCVEFEEFEDEATHAEMTSLSRQSEPVSDDNGMRCDVRLSM